MYKEEYLSKRDIKVLENAYFDAKNSKTVKTVEFDCISFEISPDGQTVVDFIYTDEPNQFTVYATFTDVIDYLKS